MDELAKAIIGGNAVKTKCSLIADTRERHVTRHQQELSEVNLIIKQITVGDYVVVSPDNEIMAIIERKSLEDFAASLKDGRADNRTKLVELREQTGCRIIYLIEGPEFPSPNDLFGRIPYKNIEASIFHLMMRDCVQVIRTKDTLDTAKTLTRFMKSMDSLCAKMENLLHLECPKTIFEGGDEQNLDELLTSRHQKSDHEIAQQMWGVFSGLSVESSSEFIKTWTVAEIVSGKIAEKDIRDFKLISGRKISKKAADALIDVTKNTADSKKTQIRLLQCVPGISHQTAVDLLTVHLRVLLSYGADGIEIIPVGKARRKLGPKLAEKIVKHFNYKFQKEPIQPPQPQVTQMVLPTAESLGLSLDDINAMFGII